MHRDGLECLSARNEEVIQTILEKKLYHSIVVRLCFNLHPIPIDNGSSAIAYSSIVQDKDHINHQNGFFRASASSGM